MVKRINGEPVSNPAQAYQAYQKALSGPAVKVEVERSRPPPDPDLRVEVAPKQRRTRCIVPSSSCRTTPSA